ncbi:uncharacterized protein PV09_04445 [Verruconis gallopava]|uniref:Nuclear distribution protein RO10 n=1 Tax=Verruconis gallopava TaxID=253628 RepID=A0A0D1YVI0_9PEZI|nr:uncharacterized protein PV09_04445 [Verruconis gallopava]KIW04712.1 hypothetical protein PV09_04445 [Verruconis gallopava]
MDTLPPEELLVHTLDLLEYRLHRLEFMFNGGDEDSPQLPKGVTVSDRIDKLQKSLGQLAARSRTVEQLLKLQSQQPELFQPADSEDEAGGDGPDEEQKLSLVLSEAPSYLATASQLRSLQDIPLPPTESFTQLVSQAPRFAGIMAVQDQQARDIAELRIRSALLVARWYEVQILGLGRCWADWEERMRGIERGVGRAESRSEAD